MTTSGATFEIFYGTPAGTTLSVLESVMRFQTIQVINRVGYFMIDIPRSSYPVDIGIDSLIKINRRPAGGSNQRLFTGLLRRVRKGHEFFTLSGFDLNYLLTTRIIAYSAGSSQAQKTGASDDVLKALVRENLGSSATDASRDLSAYITVEADGSAGNTITKGFSWKPLYDTMIEIADDEKEAGSPLYWTFTARESEGDFFFQTFTGQPGVDRTVSTGGDPLIFGPGYGNLESPILDIDYGGSWNYVYVGGQGEGPNRDITEASSSARIALSVYNRREVFRDARNADTTELSTIGNAELRLGRPRRIFTGEIQSTPQSRLGIDWNLGDRVTIEFDGDTFEGVINQLSVSVGDSGRETINADIDLDD